MHTRQKVQHAQANCTEQRNEPPSTIRWRMCSILVHASARSCCASSCGGSSCSLRVSAAVMKKRCKFCMYGLRSASVLLSNLQARVKGFSNLWASSRVFEYAACCGAMMRYWMP